MFNVRVPLALESRRLFRLLFHPAAEAWAEKSVCFRRLVFHRKVFFKKFANCRLALTIERLPKLLISYPDLFLTKQALLIRDLGTRLRHHKIKRSEFYQTSPVLGQSEVMPQARSCHNATFNCYQTTVQRLFDISYRATIRTGALERRLSNHNVFWKQKILRFFFLQTDQ